MAYPNKRTKFGQDFADDFVKFCYWKTESKLNNTSTHEINPSPEFNKDVRYLLCISVDAEVHPMASITKDAKNNRFLTKSWSFYSAGSHFESLEVAMQYLVDEYFEYAKKHIRIPQHVINFLVQRKYG